MSILETHQSSNFGVGMLASPKGPGGSCLSSECRDTVYLAIFGIFRHFDPSPKLERSAKATKLSCANTWKT